MDLRFNKAKRELIKEIEISDDASIVDRFLVEIQALRAQNKPEVVPITLDAYRQGVIKSIADAENGEVYSMDEVDKIFGLN